jgi:hypothetical protein
LWSSLIQFPAKLNCSAYSHRHSVRLPLDRRRKTGSFREDIYLLSAEHNVLLGY